MKKLLLAILGSTIAGLFVLFAERLLDYQANTSIDVEYVVRAYYGCIGRADVQCALTYRRELSKKLRENITKTEYSQINSLQILRIDNNSAVVSIDIKGKLQGMAEESWHLDVVLGKYQNGWKINTMQNAVKIYKTSK